MDRDQGSTSDRPPASRYRSPGLDADVAELRRAAIVQRWGPGFAAVGWVHLATFLASHALYRAGDLAPGRYLALWGIEAAVVAALIRRTITAGGRRPAPPLAPVLARVWITFLILGFSVASVNNLTGMPPEWFKPAWATLSTFGFAMMAWLVNFWFLVPAVQMSLTGMLMAATLPNAYAIYAVSWWLALQGIAIQLERVRRSAIARGEIPLDLTGAGRDPVEPDLRLVARSPGLH